MEENEYIEDLSECFKVIGHPIRLKIIIGLLVKKRCVKELWDCLGLPQAAVSQHLAILKNKNIVGVKKIGVKREYFLKSPIVEKIVQLIISEMDAHE